MEVAEGARRTGEDQGARGPDIAITEAFNFVDPVVENYRGSMYLLFEGAALAILVVWLFLRDLAATVVAATALPLSAIPDLRRHVLRLGFSINVSRCCRCRWWWASWWTTPSSRSRTSCATCPRGKDAVPGGDGSGRRDRPGGDRHHLHLVTVFLPTAFMGASPGASSSSSADRSHAVFFPRSGGLLTPMMAAWRVGGGDPSSPIPRRAVTFYHTRGCSATGWPR